MLKTQSSIRQCSHSNSDSQSPIGMLISDCQFRRFDSFPCAAKAVHDGVQNASGQQCSLNRIRGLSGVNHLFDCFEQVGEMAEGGFRSSLNQTAIGFFCPRNFTATA